MKVLKFWRWKWYVRSLIYILIALFTFVKVIHTYDGIDPRLQGYYNSFIEFTGVQDPGITMGIGKIRVLSFTEGTVIGICHMAVLSDLKGEVIISSDAMRYMDDIELMFLVWHEMQHCICHSYHQEGKFADGCANTIMNPYLPESFCLKKHTEEYLIKVKQDCTN